MSQTEQIHKHLKEGNTITSLEAIERFGVTRLSARIYELRQQGVNIEDQYITVTNRFGEEVEVKMYYLSGKAEVAA